MVGGTAFAVWAWWTGRSRMLVAGAVLAFGAGGARLAGDAWQQAWRPPLRAALEQAARLQRTEALAEGRSVSEDEEAFLIVAGALRADAAPTASGVSLSLAVDDPAAGGILATVVGTLAAERMGEWRAGRRVRIPVHLRRPSRYFDPGVPDFERALARRGTTLVGSVKSGALVEVTQRGGRWDEAVARMRAFARRALADAVGRWSPQSGAIAAAIVIGDRVGLSDDVQRRLQEAGTYHVIAISGGNIAILAGLLIAAFRLAGLLGRGAAVAAIAVLVAYADIVGGGASVDRATLMAVVYFAGRALDQRSPSLNTLAVAAALLTVCGPLSILDPAFVLTFGATLAILVVVPAVLVLPPLQPLRPLPPFVAPMAAMFLASAATEAMLLPVGALVFSRVTFAGLGLNFLAIPLMAVTHVAGMAVIPVALLSTPAAAWVGYVAHLGALGLVGSADLVRYVPMLSYRVAPPNTGVVAVYYAALGASWVLWRRVRAGGTAEVSGARRARVFTGAIVLSAAVWIVVEPWTLWTMRGDGRLHVTFIDVGQGDAIFARFPHGSSLLVDAGGLPDRSTFDIGDRVVAPVLRDQGVRRLDTLVFTHGDPDHIGGAPGILREIRPREVWEGISVPRSEPLAALRLQAQASGARWVNASAGDRVLVDGVELLVRHPGPADWERQRVRNDDSIVLEIGWRDVSILLTGDVGKAVERTLTDSGPRRRLRVLKAPHHGSLTSSTPEWLRALDPEVVVISAGRGNHFGHPAPEVLRRYRDVGAEIFRTDRDGAVTIDTDGSSLDVRTFTGRQIHLSTVPNHEDTKRTKDTKP